MGSNGMSARTGYLIEAVTQYASGNTSGEEYILREFLETTIDLAELVVYISMFNYVVGKISGGTTGGKTEGEGTGGSGGGIQYEFSSPISELLDAGILRKVGD